jgi:hypothetical protein
LPTVARSRSWKARLLFLAYAATTLATFVLFDVVLAERQLGPRTAVERAQLLHYWDNAFPPDSPTQWPRWLLLTHTGMMMTYPPVGGGKFAGATAFALFVGGCLVSWQRGDRKMLVICLLPFALNLAAAILHKYPYGNSERTCQHLAPFVCIMVGVGLAALIDKLAATPTAALWATQVVVLLMGAYGCIQMFTVVARPYKFEDDLWAKKTSLELVRHVKPGDCVIVLNRPECIFSALAAEAGDRPAAFLGSAWYLRASGLPVHWGADSCAITGLDATSRIWCLHYWEGPRRTGEDPIAIWRFHAGRPLDCILHVPYAKVARFDRDVEMHLDIYCFVAAEAPESARDVGLMSIWP